MKLRLLTIWRKESLRLFALWITITLVWCLTFNKFDKTGWETPPSYGGDTWIYSALVKGASEGQYIPFAFKHNRYFNAPFEANWTDYPMTEDFLYAGIGLCARLIGIFPALNLYFLLACLLAATTFYLTCRQLRWLWEWCWAGGLTFGASSYIFVRGVNHIMLSFYWHLPLCLLVTWWVASNRGVKIGERRFWVGMAISFVTGSQNPYYTQWYLQLLVLAALAHSLRYRNWNSLWSPVCLLCATILALVLANLDTVVYGLVYGANQGAVVRNYSGVETFSMRPVELFLPASHQLTAFSDLTKSYKSDLAMPLNEPTYLGLVGAFGFVAMSVQAVLGLLRGKDGSPSGLALQSFWLLGYSMVGALNGLLAVAGFQLFRAQNRVSVLLLALSLFYVIQSASRFASRWSRKTSVGLASLLCILAVWDQWPFSISREQLVQTKSKIDSDRKFAKRIERELPFRAMVFQLPVMKHPEDHSITIPNLAYSHFRQYIFSRELRYSHGTDKGRGTEDWQEAVASLPPAEMIDALEKIGFAAICINRIGYPAKAKELLSELQKAGRSRVIISNDHELACVMLNPSPSPQVPPVVNGTNVSKGDATRIH